MELAEALFHANWSSSCSAAAPSEDSQTTGQLLRTYSNPRHADHDGNLGIPPLFWSDHGAVSFYCSYWPQACNVNIDSRCDGYDLGHLNAAGEVNTSSVWMGFCAVEEAAANAASLPLAAINEETSSEDIAGSSSANPLEPSFLSSLKSSPKRKSHVHGQDADSAATPRKKLQSLPKNGMNEQPQKTQNGVGNCDAGESDGGHTGQYASSCSSEEVSASSQEVHGTGGASLASMSSTAYDPHGKTRAGRGSATDPQSLYAKKRRERINERLRILQNLVPNGTKVDISTMLGEAVQYVKFLRLQIKLLSSDDLWMYAPIAYNGMDIGLAPQSSSLT